jgi:Fe-S-cluster containining protein
MNPSFLTPLDTVAHVECGTCSACCRRELVALVDGEDERLYPGAVKCGEALTRALREMIPSATGWALPHDKATGACGYLVEGKCSIYDKRPKVCRSFTCVGWVRNVRRSLTTRAEQRRAMRNGEIDKEMWKAGVERTPKASEN